jgi:hypothetical protein
LIELLEYVLRNAIFDGSSAATLFALILLDGGDSLPGNDLFRDDSEDDTVSREFVPGSELPDGGGAESAGARNPFFVVDVGILGLEWNKPLALGAEATRRINRDAEAVIAFGDIGPPPVLGDDAKGGTGGAPLDCVGVAGSTRDADFLDNVAARGGFSDLVRDRGLGRVGVDASI